MTVVTTNIRFDNPSDGENRWTHRQQLYCRVIRELGADIIATQEGWRSQIMDIGRCLSDHALLDTHRDWLDDRMYPCLFAAAATVEAAESGDVWLSETPDRPGSTSFGSNFPRLMTWARLRHRRDGTSYLVANFHLDNSTDETRERQLTVGLERLADVAHAEDHVILLGDFNSAAGSAVHGFACSAPVCGRSRFDPWVASGAAERGTYHAFQGAAHSYDRIDWILLDRRLSFRTIACSFDGDHGRLPSDHFPVVCRGIAPRNRIDDPDARDD